MTRRLWGVVGLALVTTLAATALVLGLRAGGGAPTPPPPGIPDPGALTGWGLPVSTLLTNLAGILVVGICLAAVLLARVDDHDGIDRSNLVRAIWWIAPVWLVLVVAQFFLTVSEVVARPVSDLSHSDVVDLLTTTTLGGATAVQVALVLLVAVTAPAVLDTPGAYIVLGLAVAALLPPVFTGHAATSTDPAVIEFTLILHIAAVSIWVGGLAALGWITAAHPHALRQVITVYSAIAACCFLAVIMTGYLNASIRLVNVDNPFGTGYGQLVVVKAVAIGCLGAFGLTHRLRTIPTLLRTTDDRRGWLLFARVAALEVCLMVATVGVAVALSRTPPPAQSGVHADGHTVFPGVQSAPAATPPAT